MVIFSVTPHSIRALQTGNPPSVERYPYLSIDRPVPPRADFPEAESIKPKPCASRRQHGINIAAENEDLKPRIDHFSAECHIYYHNR
jgi:hypothetical protein